MYNKIITIVLTLTLLTSTVSTLEPVPLLIIPGFCGSALESTTPQDLQQNGENATWRSMWVNVERIMEGITDFFTEFSLAYDPDTDTLSNRSDLLIRPVDFGGLDGVIELGTGVDSLAHYFKNFVEYLYELAPDYMPGVNLRAATFDWRCGDHQFMKETYWPRVDAMVEEMYEQNSQQKIVVIAHSLGGWTTYRWLLSKDQAWKEKYIDSYIPVGAPFAGAGIAVEGLVSGTAWKGELWGIPLLPYKILKIALRTFPGLVTMLPNINWNNSQPIAFTKQRAYYPEDIVDLLTDAGATEALAMLPGLTINTHLVHPGVDVFCFVGTGTDTFGTLEYNKDLETLPIHHMIDGDGTIPLLSAAMCTKWEAQRPDLSFRYAEVPGVSHIELITDMDCAKIIIRQAIFKLNY